MEIQGRLVTILPEQSGVSKAGNNWSKIEFVIETTETYPRKVCFTLMGEKINEIKKVQLNDLITVSFDIESREYEGRWYTSLRAWKVDNAPVQQYGAMPMQPGYQQPMYPPQQGYYPPQQPQQMQYQQQYPPQPQAQPNYPPQQGYASQQPQVAPYPQQTPEQPPFSDDGSDTNDLPF